MAEPGEWLTISIFVSSTFDDMLAERQLLASRVFPRLREWCENRRIHLRQLDLRWGVTDEMAYREHAAVMASLRGVDRAHPFLVSFVGQRYGWIPTPGEAPGANERLSSLVAQQASIVELEIIQALQGGLLSGPDENRPPPLAAFYLRDDAVLSRLPEAPHPVRATFTEEHLPDHRRRERRRLQLRAKLMKEHGAACYTARFDPSLASPELALPLEPGVDDPLSVERWRNSWQKATGVTPAGIRIEPGSEADALAQAFNEKITAGRLVDLACRDGGVPLEDRIVADLQERILAAYPDRAEPASASPLEIDLSSQAAIRVQLTEAAVPVPEIESALEAYVSGQDKRVAVVRGPVGSGKSTALAALSSKLAGRPHAVVYHRLVGASDRCSTLFGLLSSILEEHQAAFKGSIETIPDDPDGLNRLFRETFARLQERRRVVLIIDGLDALEGNLAGFAWLPVRLPEPVRLVLGYTTGANAALEALVEAEDCHTIEAAGVASSAVRRDLIESFLSLHTQALTPELREVLIESTAAGTPLFLRMILDNLRRRSVHIHLAADVRRLAGLGLQSVFGEILDSVESDSSLGPPGALVAPAALGFLALAPAGLSVEEITELVSSLYAAVISGGPEPGGQEPGGQEPGGQETDVDRIRDLVEIVLLQVRPYLLRVEGRFALRHRAMWQEAARRYILGAGSPGARVRLPIEIWHDRLADYFSGEWGWAAQGSRSRRLARWHAFRACDPEPVEVLLEDFSYLDNCRAGGPAELAELISGLEDALPYLARPNQASGLARLIIFLEQYFAEWQGKQSDEHVEHMLQVIQWLVPVLKDARTYIRYGSVLQPLEIACQFAFPDAWPDLEANRSTYTDSRLKTFSPEPRMNASERAKSWERAEALIEPISQRANEGNDSNPGRVVADIELPLILNLTTLIKLFGGPYSGKQRGDPNGFSFADELYRQRRYSRAEQLARGFAAALRLIYYRLTTPQGGRSDLAQLLHSAAASMGESSAAGAAEEWLHERAITTAQLAWQHEPEASRRQLATLFHHAPEVRFLQMNEQGTLAVSAGPASEQNVAVWDVERGLLARIIQTRSEVTAIKITPSGHRLATGHADGTLVLWHPVTGRDHWQAAMPWQKSVLHIAVSEKAELVAAADEAGNVVTYDGRTGDELARFPGEGAVQLDLDRAGQRLAIANGARTPALWDARGGSLIAKLAGHEGDVFHARFDYRDRLVTLGHQEGFSIRRWDPDTGEQTRAVGPAKSWTVPVTDWPTELRLDKYLAYTFNPRVSLLGGPDQIDLWDLDDEIHMTSINLGVPIDEVLVASLASVAHMAVLTMTSGHITIVSVASRELSLPVGDMRLAAVSWAGEKLTGSYPDGSVRIWSIRKGFDYWSRAHQAGVMCMAVGPDGSVVTGSRDHNLSIWSLADGNSRTLTGHSGDVTGVALLDNGQIVTVSADQTLRTWDPSTQEHHFLQMELHKGRRTPSRIKETEQSLAVIPLSGAAKAVRVTGPEACIAITDRSIEFVDLSAGTAVSVPATSKSPLLCMAADRQAGLLFVGAGDGCLEAWDIHSHSRTHFLDTGMGYISRILAPGGGAVLADTSSGPVIWDVFGSGELTPLKVESWGRWDDSSFESDIYGFDRIAYDPQSGALTAAGPQGISAWEAGSAALLWAADYARPRGSVAAMALSSGGRYAVVAHARHPGLALWDLESREVIDLPLRAVTRTLAFAGESRLVAGDVSGGVHCFELFPPDAPISVKALDFTGRPAQDITPGWPWRIRIDWSSRVSPPGEPVTICTTVRLPGTGEEFGPFELAARQAPVDQVLPALAEQAGDSETEVKIAVTVAGVQVDKGMVIRVSRANPETADKISVPRAEKRTTRRTSG